MSKPRTSNDSLAGGTPSRFYGGHQHRALATGVAFEWLATGRGLMDRDGETNLYVPAPENIDLRCLQALRRLPPRERETVSGLVVILATDRT